MCGVACVVCVVCVSLEEPFFLRTWSLWCVRHWMAVPTLMSCHRHVNVLYQVLHAKFIPLRLISSRKQRRKRFPRHACPMCNHAARRLRDSMTTFLKAWRKLAALVRDSCSHRCHVWMQVSAADFMKALEEVKPAFGAATESLELYRTHGILDCGTTFSHLLATLRTLVGQVQHSAKTPLLTCLLEGPAGSGKSALAATVSAGREQCSAKTAAHVPFVLGGAGLLTAASWHSLRRLVWCRSSTVQGLSCSCACWMGLLARLAAACQPLIQHWV